MYILHDNTGGITVCSDKNAAFKAMVELGDREIKVVQSVWIQEEFFRIVPNVYHSKGVDVTDYMENKVQ